MAGAGAGSRKDEGREGDDGEGGVRRVTDADPAGPVESVAPGVGCAELSHGVLPPGEVSEPAGRPWRGHDRPRLTAPECRTAPARSPDRRRPAASLEGRVVALLDQRQREAPHIAVDAALSVSRA